jgi:hypothetical protein
MVTVKLVPIDRISPCYKVADTRLTKELLDSFLTEGWKANAPNLIGYFNNVTKKIDLISGSRRYAAAVEAKLNFLPVVILDYMDVAAAYGVHDKWAELMRLADSSLVK